MSAAPSWPSMTLTDFPPYQRMALHHHPLTRPIMSEIQERGADERRFDG